jgi:hypothetical protein
MPQAEMHDAPLRKHAMHPNLAESACSDDLNEVVIEDGAYFKGSIEIEKSAGRARSRGVSNREGMLGILRSG